MLKFFDWAFRNGEKMADELDYVPLPDALTQDDRRRLEGADQGQRPARRSGTDAPRGRRSHRAVRVRRPRRTLRGRPSRLQDAIMPAIARHRDLTIPMTERAARDSRARSDAAAGAARGRGRVAGRRCSRRRRASSRCSCSRCCSAILVALRVRRAAGAADSSASAFFVTNVWNPVTSEFGALAPIYGTLVTSAIALLIGVPVSFGIALFLTEMCPPVLKRPLGTAVELLAAIPSIIYGMWGLFVFAPFFADYIQPALTRTLGRPAGASARCSRARPTASAC